jgi:hypothetical protein
MISDLAHKLLALTYINGIIISKNYYQNHSGVPLIYIYISAQCTYMLIVSDLTNQPFHIPEFFRCLRNCAEGVYSLLGYFFSNIHVPLP